MGDLLICVTKVLFPEATDPKHIRPAEPQR